MIVYYIKKKKGSRHQGISVLVSWYISKLKEKTFIVCQPGYLSSTLSKSGTISPELAKMIALFGGPNKSKLRGIFSYSMNFDLQMEFYNQLKDNYIFLDEMHVQKYSQNGKSNSKRSKKSLRDHSKCIWFYKEDCLCDSSAFDIPIQSLKDYLELRNSWEFEASKLKAAVVGSTNLSATSYFAVPTDKGESDVFFITEEGLKEVTDGKLTMKEMAFKFLDDAIKYYVGSKEGVYNELRKSIMVAETLNDENGIHWNDSLTLFNVFGDLVINLD